MGRESIGRKMVKRGGKRSDGEVMANTSTCRK